MRSILALLALVQLAVVHSSRAVLAQQNNDTQQLAQIEWWKKTNYYHIYLRSFKDSNGDGNGDLRGVIEKLDYLEQIGVETILMAPFYSSPMHDGGYDIDDYTAINPMFGTLEDFDALVGALKKRQMRIVVDFVPNHSSHKHPWFECSERALIEPERCAKYRDYYVWSSSRRFEGKYPTNWVSVFGGGPAWQWSEVRKEFYLHQFLPEQPDLNFRLPAVREEFKRIARFWLERGADGLRVDSAIYLIEDDREWLDEQPNPEWKPGDDPADRLLHTSTRCLPESAQIVADWRQVAQEFAGHKKVIITEAYDRIDKLIEYYGKSPSERYADLPFNFELLKLNSDNWDDAGLIARTARNWIGPTRALKWPNEHGAMAPWIIWVTGNHDNKRLVNKIGIANVATFKWLTYMLPGVPVNYYGDEVPVHDANFNSIPKRTIDEGEPTRLAFRAPIAWTDEQPAAGFSSTRDIWMPLNADFGTQNVRHLLSAQSGERNELKLFVALQRLRKQRLALFTFGDLVFFETTQRAEEGKQQVLAVARTHHELANLLLLANLSAEQALVVNLSSRPGHTSEIFNQSIGPDAVPKRGEIVLLNRVDEKHAAGLIEGAQVELESLVLGPSQSLLIEY